MARNISLSLGIDLHSSPLIWTAGIAEYIGWIDEMYGSPVAVLRVVEPAQYAGYTRRVLPERCLPAEICARVPRDTAGRFSRKLHRERRPIGGIEVLISDAPPGFPAIVDQAERPKLKIDGWQIRDEFLRLRRTTPALLEFLNRYGVWEHTPQLIEFEGSWDRGWHEIVMSRFKEIETPWFEATKPRYIPEISTPDEVWNRLIHSRGPLTAPLPPPKWVPLQALIKWGLTHSFGEWLESGLADVGMSGHVGEVQLDGPRSEFPHFMIRANGCLPVMLATVTIDHLTGTKFRTCVRHDCGVPFAVESRHKRRYCSQYCAHLESVRRNRRKADRRGSNGKQL